MSETYHKDTRELAWREIKSASHNHKADLYLAQLLNTIEHYRTIEEFVACLERISKKKQDDIADYPTDYSYINECREHVRRNREWIARCAELSLKAAENEKKTNEILARLDGMMSHE
jgi:hypothetical protein